MNTPEMVLVLFHPDGHPVGFFCRRDRVYHVTSACGLPEYLIGRWSPGYFYPVDEPDYLFHHGLRDCTEQDAVRVIWRQDKVVSVVRANDFDPGGLASWSWRPMTGIGMQ